MKTTPNKGQVKGCDGKIIKNQDWVSHISRTNNLPAIGQIHHIIGSSFAIEVPKKHRALYSFKEIQRYEIKLHNNQNLTDG